MSSSTSSKTRSGMKQFQPGEILFHDAEPADSLFIIQKGQIRLFKPKGKGFIEIAVLRAGEVIGEMAYFDEQTGGRKRSCSASAITPVEVVEISFVAFGKTMHSLNPWFKTIINTLVSRLKKSNMRLKELEDNQASVSYGSKGGNYEFLRPLEVLRILGSFFLIFKAHGEVKNQALVVHKKTLNLYMQDMFQILEVKIESLIEILTKLGWMEVKEDEDGFPYLLCIKNLEIIRQIFLFYNAERHLVEEKKMKVGDKCEKLIALMLKKSADYPLEDIPNLKIIDGIPPKFTKCYDITDLITELKAEGVMIKLNHLDDGKSIHVFGEVIMQDKKVLVETDFEKLKKMYPIIMFANTVKRLNIEKQPVNSL